MAETLASLFAPTKAVYTMWIIMAVLVAFSIIATRNMKDRPGVLQNIAEWVVSGLMNMFGGVLGEEKAKKYLPVFGTLFVFIIVCNYSGLLPFAGEAFTVPTSQLAVTAGLAMVAFFTIHTIGFKTKGFGGYLKSFVSIILPLTLIEQITRPLSLALRLYGNIYGEEQVTETLYGLFPVLLPLLMQVLSLLFCYIQAMVFTMLLAVYVDEATEISEPKPPKQKKAKKKLKKAQAES